MLLLGLRKIASTNVAPQTLPLDWTPISITIPDLIVVKCGYVCLICRNFSQNLKGRPRTGPKFQSVVCFHIDDACSYKLIRMKNLSAIRPFCLNARSRDARRGGWCDCRNGRGWCDDRGLGNRFWNRF